ncbi:hypothetical protein RHMOL_Rhmol06G0234400 [Rhododendron molle]|uniref:Uncharacterized protein n=1 Tax=Rhododendron molle TaxID=49168 RepID=A0ACC0NFE1_RHOML|nr:hypothetical protein RHMOL_Rhmol06G0234400 [Rhododendron molle]
MKKLLNSKGKVHPSPPPAAADHRLSFLPAAILTLAAALSPEDQEVLAYLISCSGSSTNFSGHHSTSAVAGGGSSGGDHSPEFHCNCFRCYMSYWVKWDASPNRQVIHQILDEYEDGLLDKKKKVKKERRRRVVETGGESKCDSGNSGELGSVEASGIADVEVVSGEDCEVGGEKGAVTHLTLVGATIPPEYIECPTKCSQWEDQKPGQTNSCLLIQLRRLDSIPECLKEFLADPEICFVGVGTRCHRRMLKTYCEIELTNGIDVSDLAAKVLKKSDLDCLCPLGKIAAIAGVSLPEYPGFEYGIDVEAKFYTGDEIKRMVYNVYGAHLIGTELLGLL